MTQPAEIPAPTDPTPAPAPDPTPAPAPAPTLDALAQTLDAAFSDHTAKRSAQDAAHAAAAAADNDEAASHKALADAVAAIVAKAQSLDPH